MINHIFLGLFEEKTIFSEDLSAEGHITEKILWKIFVMLSAQDSEYLIGF